MADTEAAIAGLEQAWAEAEAAYEALGPVAGTSALILAKYPGRDAAIAYEANVFAGADGGHGERTNTSRCPPSRGGETRRAAAMTEPELSRYELLHDDPRFGLVEGDVLICGRMHWAWAPEKVAVLRRESDGYEPGCSMYRDSVRHLSGPQS